MSCHVVMSSLVPRPGKTGAGEGLGTRLVMRAFLLVAVGRQVVMID